MILIHFRTVIPLLENDFQSIWISLPNNETGGQNLSTLLHFYSVLHVPSFHLDTFTKQQDWWAKPFHSTPFLLCSTCPVLPFGYVDQAFLFWVMELEAYFLLHLGVFGGWQPVNQTNQNSLVWVGSGLCKFFNNTINWIILQ